MLTVVTGSSEVLSEQQSDASPKTNETGKNSEKGLFSALFEQKVGDKSKSIAELLKGLRNGKKTVKQSVADKTGKSELKEHESGDKLKRPHFENLKKAGTLKETELSGKVNKSKLSIQKKGVDSDKPELELEQNAEALLNPDVISTDNDRAETSQKKGTRKAMDVESVLKSGTFQNELGEQTISQAEEGGSKQKINGSSKPRHLMVDLRQNAQNANADSGNSGAGSNDGSSGNSGNSDSSHITVNAGKTENFGEMSISKQKESLTSRLRDGINQDIVKQSRFIINNNKGEIKLVLKPEHLGKVRIQINLEDNHIAGKIIVENNIVKEAFEQNMKHLQDAFKQSGFESAALDVSVESKNQGGQKGSGQGSRRKAVMQIEEQLPAVREIVRNESLIDLIA